MFQAKFVPLPSGPFESWPLEIRDAAIASLRDRSMFRAVSLLGAYEGSPEAAGKGILAFASFCVARTVPADWPGRPAELAQAFDALEDAKRLDPKLPDIERFATPE